MIPAQPAVVHHGHCHTHTCWHRLSVRRHREFWPKRFHRFPIADQRWAKCIANYETRGTPWNEKATVNTGNGYYGAVQFSYPTAQAAGFHERPDHTTIWEQLVRAILWGRRAGHSQWSTSRYCG